MNKSEILSQIKFNKEGLIPVIIQDEKTNQVLMLAYMNRESLEKTLEEERTCFYSRSRSKLWFKGSTSGNTQLVKKVILDCDNDTLLVLVEQKGVACHTGNYSCFFKEIKCDKIEEIKLESPIYLRKEQAEKIKSSQGESKGEQLEVDSEIEVADLWFHTLVALGSCNISPQDIFKELKKRRK
jgi:phosphoribosyl-ATP pyrophosphohydrolase/phosphoribosyl-AMP cyclohydrolase